MPEPAEDVVGAAPNMKSRAAANDDAPIVEDSRRGTVLLPFFQISLVN